VEAAPHGTRLFARDRRSTLTEEGIHESVREVRGTHKAS